MLRMGKAHLKIRYHNRELGLKKDRVMNMGLDFESYFSGNLLTGFI